MPKERSLCIPKSKPIYTGTPQPDNPMPAFSWFLFSFGFCELTDKRVMNDNKIIVINFFIVGSLNNRI